MRERMLVSWSGGKDSALAFYEIQKTDRYEILALLTTVTKDYDRISMHGVRRILLEQQAESMGYSLEKMFISHNASNEEYESEMREKHKFSAGVLLLKSTYLEVRSTCPPGHVSFVSEAV